MSKNSILTINPGSTSTKIAVYDELNLVFSSNISHSTEELAQFPDVASQFAFRHDVILHTLECNHISTTNFAVVVGRGGVIRPIESGVYEVNDKMLDDCRSARYGEHASNLGALLAHEIATKIPACRAFIADPVVVDELQDVAKISGLPQIPRRSIFHALNQKAIARKYAAQKGVAYESLNVIVAHLGGGISVAAHRNGRAIDVNQALGGFGPFSPERAGTLDGNALVELCFSGKYSEQEIKKLLVGKGGLVAHLGSNDGRVVEQRAKSGDEQAALVMHAMGYNIAKEIGSLIPVLKGQAECVILTGGMANNPLLVKHIKEYIEPVLPIVMLPGEDEMEALADAGLRVLKGEIAKDY
ncbi:MAG: butyrate kinase [Prevotellaceae bacterium]|jgi:butyrate kinase|nr:butyrate kinase [Prevotellaceae bacterium]